MGGVFISPNIQKTSDRIDLNGNIIDPRTKQIIVPRESEYVPPAVPNVSEPTTTTAPEAKICPSVGCEAKDDGLSVLDEIEATKKRLAELEETKKVKIQELEKELNKLKQ